MKNLPIKTIDGFSWSCGKTHWSTFIALITTVRIEQTDIDTKWREKFFQRKISKYFYRTCIDHRIRGTDQKSKQEFFPALIAFTTFWKTLKNSLNRLQFSALKTLPAVSRMTGASKRKTWPQILSGWLSSASTILMSAMKPKNIDITSSMNHTHQVLF